jgi:hypothetical protein
MTRSDLLTYFFVPGMMLLNVILFFHMRQYYLGSIWISLLANWLWLYPWFVRLVVRSLLGLEP